MGDSKDDQYFGVSLVDDIDASKAKSVQPDRSQSKKDSSSWTKSKYQPPKGARPMIMPMTNKNSNNNNNNTSSGHKGSFGGSNSGSVNRSSKGFRGKLTSGRGRSGTLSKTCELVSNNMDTDKTITVKFFHAWDKFFTSEAFNDVVKGFKISEINNNAYGNEFKDTGVSAGWQLVKIGKRKVGNKHYTVIRGDLEKNSKFGGKGGYVATFLDVTGDKTQKDKTPKQTQTTTSTTSSSTVANTNNNSNNSKAKHAMISQTPQVRSSNPVAKKGQYNRS